MCNLAAAVAGVGLLMLMGRNRKQKEQPRQAPSAPMPSTNYSSAAGSQASINQSLPEDSTGSPSTSSAIVAKKTSGPSGTSYRNPMAIPRPATVVRSGLPTIGGVNAQKPVNY